MQENSSIQTYPENNDLMKLPISRITDVYMVIIENPNVKVENLSDTMKNINPKVFQYVNLNELPSAS